jgi:hypothetical protein
MMKTLMIIIVLVNIHGFNCHTGNTQKINYYCSHIPFTLVIDRETLFIRYLLCSYELLIRTIGLRVRIRKHVSSLDSAKPVVICFERFFCIAEEEDAVLEKNMTIRQKEAITMSKYQLTTHFIFSIF